jgi:hypothetical protein
VGSTRPCRGVSPDRNAGDMREDGTCEPTPAVEALRHGGVWPTRSLRSKRQTLTLDEIVLALHKLPSRFFARHGH